MAAVQTASQPCCPATCCQCRWYNVLYCVLPHHTIVPVTATYSRHNRSISSIQWRLPIALWWCSEVKSVSKRDVAVCNYSLSSIRELTYHMESHTLLPATRQRWHLRYKRNFGVITHSISGEGNAIGRVRPFLSTLPFEVTELWCRHFATRSTSTQQAITDAGAKHL